MYFPYYLEGIFRMKVIPSCLSEGCSSGPLLADLCHHVPNLLSVAFLLYTFCNISSTSVCGNIHGSICISTHIRVSRVFCADFFVACGCKVANKQNGKELSCVIDVYNTCHSCLAFSSIQNTWLDRRTLSVCLMCFWM